MPLQKTRPCLNPTLGKYFTYLTAQSGTVEVIKNKGCIIDQINVLKKPNLLS